MANKTASKNKLTNNSQLKSKNEEQYQGIIQDTQEILIETLNQISHKIKPNDNIVFYSSVTNQATKPYGKITSITTDGAAFISNTQNINLTFTISIFEDRKNNIVTQEILQIIQKSLHEQMNNKNKGKTKISNSFVKEIIIHETISPHSWTYEMKIQILSEALKN